MKTEFEAAFADQNHEAVREKLKSVGAKLLQPMRLMKRDIFDLMESHPYRDEGFVRLRDEGDKVTLTYKQFDSLKVDGAKEIETDVGDYDATKRILEQTGLIWRSFQESKRETWELDGVKIELDEWPWLKPFVEVEADSEAEVRQVVSKLGYKWEDAIFGDVMAVYRHQYPHLSVKDSVVSMKKVRFDDPIPDLLKANR